jgi:cytochrome b6-f complex iron-sulfur subunit
MKFLVAFVTILIVGTVSAFAPTPYFLVHPKTTMATTRWASSTTEEYYIDNQRRSLMNLLMVGTGGLTVVGFGLPFILFFYPQGAGSGSSTTVAQDALGKEIFAKDYLASKPANDRSLVQGLKGDPT